MKALQTLPKMTDRVGRYRILSDLGRGSMAQVYLALDPNIDREVALKVFRPRYDVGPEELAEMRRRFIEEAKAAGRVRHPGVVTIYDADTDPEHDLSYIAMERIEGRSLWEILASDGPMPELPAVEIVAKVALALHAAHEDGLVHLDVKPGNILCSLDGSIKVTDFGIAQLSTAARNQTDWISGSPFYMSPEQLAGGEVDVRSDVYSLGAVFYECLCGAVPFTSESLAGLRYMIEEIDPRPLQTFDSRIRGELACVAMKALSKLPADRFQTTFEMAQALGSAMAVAPILVNAPKPVALPTAQPIGPGPIIEHETPAPEALPVPEALTVPEELATPEEPAPEPLAARPPETVSQARPPRDRPAPRRSSRAMLFVLLLLLAAGIGGLAFELDWLDADPSSSGGVSAPVVEESVPAGKRIVVESIALYAAAPFEDFAADRFDLVEPPPAPAEIEAAAEARRAAIRERNETARRLAAEAAQLVAERDSSTVTGPVSLLSASELAPAEEVAAAPAPMATLEILFRNRLKGGSVAVWIDGEPAWNRSFDGAKNVFRRTVGKDISLSLPVPAGEREITVRISGANGKLDETRETRATFDADQTRRLRLVHLPPRGLRLSWKDSGGE